VPTQNSDLRIVFAGTPEFAASHLEALIARGFNVVSAYSQPDRPSGRGKKVSPTPVKAVAEQHGIAVNQPLTLSDPAVLSRLQAYRPDLIVVVAYGLLLPPAVLVLPRLGCINVHASLLPRWRGAAPIERALMAGDQETGICIMQMDEGLDTGPVLASTSTAITALDNSQTLSDRLVEMGCRTLVSTLPALANGTLHATAQSAEGATYARKLRKEEALIHWQDAAVTLDAKIRALFPRSPAFTWYRGQRLRILRAIPQSHSPAGQLPGTVLAVSSQAIRVATGDGILDILELQPEGKSPMSVKSLLNGYPDFCAAGVCLLDEAAHV